MNTLYSSGNWALQYVVVKSSFADLIFKVIVTCERDGYRDFYEGLFSLRRMLDYAAIPGAPCARTNQETRDKVIAMFFDKSSAIDVSEILRAMLVAQLYPRSFEYDDPMSFGMLRIDVNTGTHYGPLILEFPLLYVISE